MRNPFSKLPAGKSPGFWVDVAAWAGLVLVLILAATTRARLPQVPLAEYDTWGWLGSALGWLGGLGFREVFEREWLYSAFLAACLNVGGSFATIVQVQQFLGVLSGALAFLTWQVWLAFLRLPWPAKAVASLVGLLVITMNLQDPHLLVLELSMRPEGILVPIAFAQLACITLFAWFWWRDPKFVPALVFGALAVPLAYALYVLKPNWALAVPLTLLPLPLAFFSPRLLQWRAFSPATGGALLTILCIWLPGKLLFQGGGDRVVLPMTLLTIHGDIVLKSLQESPLQGHPAQTVDILAAEMENARNEKIYYHRLGFDPDYLMYRAGLFPWLEHEKGYTKRDIAKFCFDTYFHAWRTNPGLMIRKILVQFDYVLRPDRATFTRQKTPLQKLYAHTHEIYETTLQDKYAGRVPALYHQWRGEVEALMGRELILRAARPFFDFRSMIATAVPWISLGFLAVWIATFFVGRFQALQLPGFLVFVFWMAPVGNALTVAVAHALDNSRYRLSYGGLLFFACAAMGVYLGTVIIRAASRKGSS